MDWEEYFVDTQALVEGANARIYQDKGRIRYVNARYKCFGQPESEWLYDVEIFYEEGQLCIRQKEGDGFWQIAKDQLEYLKLRPFYYAICVGFKVFIFYAYPQEKNPSYEQNL